MTEAAAHEETSPLENVMTEEAHPAVRRRNLPIDAPSDPPSAEKLAPRLRAAEDVSFMKLSVNDGGSSSELPTAMFGTCTALKALIFADPIRNENTGPSVSVDENAIRHRTASRKPYEHCKGEVDRPLTPQTPSGCTGTSSIGSLSMPQRERITFSSTISFRESFFHSCTSLGVWGALIPNFNPIRHPHISTWSSVSSG